MCFPAQKAGGNAVRWLPCRAMVRVTSPIVLRDPVRTSYSSSEEGEGPCPFNAGFPSEAGARSALSGCPQELGETWPGLMHANIVRQVTTPLPYR